MLGLSRNDMWPDDEWPEETNPKEDSYDTDAE